VRPHLTRKKLDVVVCACHPSYSGKPRPNIQNNQSKKGLEAWLKW
jgi:hypothetical protein